MLLNLSCWVGQCVSLVPGSVYTDSLFCSLKPQQKFACNGTVIEHPEYGEVIQLQGDQRKNICHFIMEASPNTNQNTSLTERLF